MTDKAKQDARDLPIAEELAAYLLEASDPSQPLSRRCLRFVLVHVVVVGETESAQCERVLADDAEGLDRLGDERARLAELYGRSLARAAGRLADQRARRQSFAIAAYASTAEDATPKDRYPFSVDPVDKPSDVVDGERADEQIQRIADTAIKEMSRVTNRAIQAHEAVVGQWQAYATTLQTRLQGSDERQVTLFQNYQAALDTQAQRQVQSDKAAFYLSMQREGWDLVKQALPVLLDRAGRGPLSNLLRELASDPDRIEMFVKVATPEQRGALHAAIVTYMPELLDRIVAARLARQQAEESGVVVEQVKETKH